MSLRASPASEDAPPPRTVARVMLLAGLALAFLGFIALGIWQIERRAWKLDLIQRVEARVHASPVPPPAPAQWAAVSATRDEYRRVTVSGRFLDQAGVRVQAVTAIGSGYWWVVPLQRDDGTVVLVNRGFVTPDWKPRPRPETATSSLQQVTGLLRLSEPDGGFLRNNAPAEGRWYSRDVAAIAAAQGLDPVAPYFIDADAQTQGSVDNLNGADGPVGGLTVVSFRNQHLQYALTWFALALMVVAALWRVLREERRRSLHH